MERLANALKFQASALDRSAPVGRWGVVSGIDTTIPAVKVRLQPEDVQTDWLPLLSSMVGGGWGMVHVPATGTPVFCLPDAGDINSYVVVGATWSASRTPPETQQGELWLVHESGSKINLTHDGKVKIADAGGCSLEFTNTGTATLTGTLVVTGDILDLNTAHGSIHSLRTAYNQHKHTGVQAGASTTNITDHVVS